MWTMVPDIHPQFHLSFWLGFILSLLLGACNPQTNPITATIPSKIQTATLTPTSARTPTPTLLPTQTDTPSETPTLTPTWTPSPPPEPLPIFISQRLRSDVEPQAYLNDTCLYLARRWAVNGSVPGTVVQPVMFHSVVKEGHSVTDPKDISESDFISFMQYARYLGFETITTDQLIAFLDNNAYIPERSMILILDDRRPGVVATHFMPILRDFGWSLTLGYIADPDSLPWAMEQIMELNQSGHLDVQSHGFSGTLYITQDTPEQQIRSEILDATQVLADNFGQRPTAFIWPGGNFTSLAVHIAREGGYRVGFTAFSRGPLLFNWVPLGEKEKAIGDPLMVLPRAWSNSMPVNLDIAVAISQEMHLDALQKFAAEAQYFRTYCGGELPQQ